MSSVEVAPARPDDVDRCPAIERRAAALFPDDDLPPNAVEETTALETLERAQREGRLFVARVDGGKEPVGFVLVEDHGDEAHLEELDVLPEYGRRGIGRALVEAACAWAAAEGHAGVTLSTFRHLPWNAPFYESAGFVAIPRATWTPALAEAAEEEAASGLDLAKRVMMRRVLD